MAEPYSSGFVKICGVTRESDAAMVVDAGASALGIILATSPRRVGVDQGRRLADAVRGRIISTVVVRSMRDDDVVRGVDVVEPDAVQVHGPLSETLHAALRSRGLLIVKALSVGTDEFLAFDDDGVDAVLIDGPSPGSGVEHSWDDLVARPFRVPVIAAGGLTSANVHDTIVVTRALGVDTASGVESAPGVKDPTLVRRFVESARRTYEQQGAT